MNKLAKIPVCRLLLLLSVSVMMSACVNTLELAVPRGDEQAGVTHEGAVANAREYFYSHFGSSTRSEEQQPTPEAPYVVGNLVPDWDSGVSVSNEEKSYTDFEMRKDSRFFLALKDEEDRLCGFELYSRLASVDDFGLDTLNQYVATYIPDISFLSCYESFRKDNLLTCEYVDWFTGVILYTDLYGHHIAAYKYYDGQLTDSSFLYDGQKTPEENVADFMRVMGGISLFIAPAEDETRAVATVDIPGGTYICCYDETTGKVIWEYYNIDTISIVNTNHTFYDPFALSGGGASTSIDSGVGTTIARPDIPSGGGGGSTTTTEEEEKEDEDEFEKKLVEDLFDTSDLSDDKVKALGEMLKEIIQDCMGGVLYSKLVEVCEDNGQLSIIFASSGAVPSYKNTTRTITITDNYSDTLLHEMFHAYQDVMIDSDLSTISTNLEIEAQVAKYKYAYREGSPISDERKISEYRDDDMEESFYSIHCATTEDASAKSGLIDNFYKLYEKAVEEVMAKSDLLHLGYQFDAERSMDDNWSNIIELSIKCE